MKRLCCVALCLCLLAGCGVGDRGESTTIFSMDTVMELTAYGDKAQMALDEAVREINRLDALLSAHWEGSAVWEINASDGETVTVAPEVGDLLQMVIKLYTDTMGALDITVYPAMEAWGFTTGEYRVPSGEELSELRELVDGERLSLEPWRASGVSREVTLSPGMKIDLGAVGKGYAGDRIITLWKEMGVTSGLLNLGGNVQCLGAKPDGSDWTVAIRDPNDPDGILATVSGRDMAVVTSGGYQRYFEENGTRYHHILDPKTCAPADSGAASVSVVGSSGFICDGLSTALFVMGLEDAADYWRQSQGDFDMIYYTEDGTLWYTPGLKDRLEPREGLEGQMLT